MEKIIKQMRKIIGDDWSSQIHAHIFKDEIYFGIYESEIVVIIDLKKKEVYVECETGYHLTDSMLDELSKIVKLLEENLNVIEEFLEWD